MALLEKAVLQIKVNVYYKLPWFPQSPDFLFQSLPKIENYPYLNKTNLIRLHYPLHTMY